MREPGHIFVYPIAVEMKQLRVCVVGLPFQIPDYLNIQPEVTERLCFINTQYVIQDKMYMAMNPATWTHFMATEEAMNAAIEAASGVPKE